MISLMTHNYSSVGQCDSSALTISNSKDGDGHGIGTFCNVRRPPLSILSDFNQLFLTFQSGAEDSGNGFLAEYTQLRRDNVPPIPEVPGTFCPNSWTYFKDNCYRVFDNNTLLSWTNAEDKCNDEGAHLTSIRDGEDMEFIHSLVVGSLGSSATPPIKTFIGLVLPPESLVHNWIDERPLSYTDWIVPNNSKNWELRQPDGGRLESCVLIDMANFHSTDHWHDVPCVADNEGDRFICMKPSDGQMDTTNTSIMFPAGEEECSSNMDTCLNGECSHAIFSCQYSGCLPDSVCDTRKEVTTTETSRRLMLRGNCLLGEFQCSRSSECIPVSFLCDFISQCNDGSDEEQCYFPPCEDAQHTCLDGQCIDAAKQCDLVKDCVTGSDEHFCDESPVGVQCYDGTWLPIHAYCDGQRDCAGKNWEDEDTDCALYQANFTCESGKMRCKNGGCVDWQHRCQYNRDQYGLPMGCRDATHLEDCRK
ncbi:uncharacterized protein [Amphiura filiformis]|uniref:uncharacterized protein n=1 Tax=Amphiura filiformis TaxID=82378 RepID=UPI003B2199EA